MHDILRRFADGIIQNHLKNIKKAGNEGTRRVLSRIYAALEDNVKQAVDPVVEDNTIRTILDRVSKSEKMAQ